MGAAANMGSHGVSVTQGDIAEVTVEALDGLLVLLGLAAGQTYRRLGWRSRGVTSLMSHVNRSE